MTVILKSVLGLIGGVTLAFLGNTSILPVQKAEAASCRGGQGIGTSRTITLNTSGGKRYGHSHGGAVNLLGNKEVVLTFDDGPVPGTTPKILHVLDKHCAKATFFMVGTMAKNNASIARQIFNKGHTIGIHSYSHKNLGNLSGSSAISDVNRSISAIETAVGRDVAPFFRFPYLAENRSVNQHLKQLGYGVFAIDVDSLDYKFSNPGSMVNRVMSELNRKGKGIILLHDIQRVTANGIDQLLNRLNSEGYKLVHIRGRGGKEPKDPVLVASNDTKAAADKPKVLLATQSDRKPRKSVKKRESKPVQVAALTKTDDKKVALKASRKAQQEFLKNQKNARKQIKNRILIDRNTTVKTAQADKKDQSKSQNLFQENRQKVLAQVNKNRQAFRNAIKKRFSTN